MNGCCVAVVCRLSLQLAVCNRAAATHAKCREKLTSITEIRNCYFQAITQLYRQLAGESAWVVTAELLSLQPSCLQASPGGGQSRCRSWHFS